MTPTAPRRLRMFAGPNGSGKSSVARLLGKEFSPDGLIHLYHFINADDLFRDFQTGTGLRFDSFGLSVDVAQLRAALASGGRVPAGHPFLQTVQVQHSHATAPSEICDAYVAAALADFLREQLLARGQSFSFETVMSHRNKVDFFARARAEGYQTYLYFIATESPILSVRRVENRRALGGHDVPADKVVERYYRSLKLVGDALAHAHRGFLFDNSASKPLWLAESTPEGKLDLKVPVEALPNWFKTWVAPRYPV